MLEQDEREGARDAGRPLRRYSSSVAAVCGATCLTWWCRSRLSLTDIAVLYTLGIMGVVTSALISRIRDQERQATERERRMAALSEHAKNTALRARTEEMRSSLLSAVSHDLGAGLGRDRRRPGSLRLRSRGGTPKKDRAQSAPAQVAHQRTGDWV